jgi:hypothetical protein
VEEIGRSIHFYAFLHCDLARKTFVAKLGVRLQIRAKSLYQLFEVIQFLKVLNRIVRGRFSLGQSLQVIALGQSQTSPRRDAAMSALQQLLPHSQRFVATRTPLFHYPIPSIPAATSTAPRLF